MSAHPFKDIILKNFKESYKFLYSHDKPKYYTDEKLTFAFEIWCNAMVHTLDGVVFELSENKSLNSFELLQYFESQLFLVKQDLFDE